MRQHGRISRVLIAVLWLLAIALVAQAQATITKQSFGKTDAGENIDLYIGGALCGSGEIVVIENTLGVRITDFL